MIGGSPPPLAQADAMGAHARTYGALDEEENPLGRRIRLAFRTSTITVSILMALCSILTFQKVSNVDQTSEAFVAFYTLLFAILIFTFELTQLLGLATMKRMFKRNLGFCFKPYSYSAFLTFVSFLLFGIEASPATDGDSNWLGFLTGSALLLEALLLTGLNCRYPHLITPMYPRLPVTKMPSSA